jgi:ribosome maturation protein Sdo1
VTIVAKAPIREAFSAALKIDPHKTLEECVEDAIQAVAKQLSLPVDLERQAI